MTENSHSTNRSVSDSVLTRAGIKVDVTTTEREYRFAEGQTSFDGQGLAASSFTASSFAAAPPEAAPLAETLISLERFRGAIFSSGFEYPGRHSRWDIGFLHPAVELITSGKNFTLRALSDAGSTVVELLWHHLETEPHIRLKGGAQSSGSRSAGAPGGIEVRGSLNEIHEVFSEEERSRQPSIFSVLRCLRSAFASRHPGLAHLGFYGAFGYDLVHQFESLDLRHSRNGEMADCHLYLPLDLVVVDRKRELVSTVSYELSAEARSGSKAVSTCGANRQTAPVELKFGSGDPTPVCDHGPGEFAAKVAKVIDGTRKGDYFEVVLSQSFSAPLQETPPELFRKLTVLNPSPYMFLVNFGAEQLVGASPEMFVRVTGRRYETCPIAGTIRRGKTALEDAERVKILLGSEKDESELTMCTDVDRNDMARVCVPGTVRVIGRRQLEFYSHLIHTVDHLEGELAEGYDGLDAFQTHMWACTVTGAPKRAAMQAIENLESSPRGWYSGAVGYLASSGDINTGILLRTAHIKDGRASVRAGATLLFGSDPVAEEEETRTKAAAFLTALSSPSLSPNATVSFAPTAPPARQKAGRIRRLLLVDYEDSFIHNLGAYFRELGAGVTTLRHNISGDGSPGISEPELDRIRPDLIVLSPGPASPRDFGIPDFIGRLRKRELPIFGVCLGHQAIGEHFGATLRKLPVPYHGKPSPVTIHPGPSRLLRGIDATFPVGRYHSLYLDGGTIPKELRVTASTPFALQATTELPALNFEVPMAIEHATLPIAGVQFHPESIMSLHQEVGYHILQNVLTDLV